MTKPTITTPKANNWVDRGESPVATLRRVLAYFFQRFDEADAPWLEQHAVAVLGMVAADSTEVHVASYLRSLLRDEGKVEQDREATRTVGLALWHVAKAALVRDFAERVLRGDVPPNIPTDDSLSHWLAGRLLTPEEFAEFERKRRPIPPSA